jgi:hypothetical protein
LFLASCYFEYHLFLVSCYFEYHLFLASCYFEDLLFLVPISILVRNSGSLFTFVLLNGFRHARFPILRGCCSNSAICKVSTVSGEPFCWSLNCSVYRRPISTCD